MEQNSIPSTITPNNDGAVQNKNVSTSKEITKSLIGNWLVWYVVLNVIYFMIANSLLIQIESSLTQIIVSIVSQALIVFCAWAMSTKFSFKNRHIERRDVKAVMKNLIIFSVVVCIANGIYQFIQAEATFNSSIESNYELRIKEKQMEQIYSTQQMSEYNKQKSEMIAEAKKQMYVNLVIVELVSVVVFFRYYSNRKKDDFEVCFQKQ